MTDSTYRTSGTGRTRMLFLSAMTAAAVIMISSCTEKIKTYDGVAGIYFAMRVESSAVNADTMYSETSSVPFIITEAEDITFNLKVKILGPVSDHDRQVTIEIVPEETDALPGDYDQLQPSYTLPAGAVFGSIPITFHKSASLEGTERQLTVRLVENSDFSLPIRMWENSSDEYVDVVKHTIMFSDKYVQLPGYATGYFGPFSEKKMALLLEVLDLKITDFNEPMPYTKARALGQKFDRYLKEQAAKGEPVLEDDGTPMTAGDYIY